MKLLVVALILAPFFFSYSVVSGEGAHLDVPTLQLYKFTASDESPGSTRAGIVRFRKEVGIPFILGALKDATDDVFETFNQQKVSDRKHLPGTEVHAFIHDFLQGVSGYYHQRDKYYQEIHISAAFIENIPPILLKNKIRGLLDHEMTHVWQWYGNEAAKNLPAWLFEGLADFVALVHGHQIYRWPKPGDGNKWDENSAITAQFLKYCEEVKPGFVPELNKMMRYDYNDDYFVKLTGKPIQQLWDDYKNKYKKS